LNLSFDGVIAQVAVSNDGGFAKAHTQIFDYQNNTITWKLRSSTTKLPRKVYVRYRSYDAANDSSYGAWNKEVYSDDIILDEVAPTISVVRASVSTGRPAVKLESRGYLPGKINTVRVTADDDRSGVAGYQVSAAPRGMRVYFVKTSNFKVMIPFNRKVLYVRAVDGAGNHGVWRQVSTK
jgi:hypothetical protein